MPRFQLGGLFLPLGLPPGLFRRQRFQFRRQTAACLLLGLQCLIPGQLGLQCRQLLLQSRPAGRLRFPLLQSGPGRFHPLLLLRLPDPGRFQVCPGLGRFLGLGQPGSGLMDGAVQLLQLRRALVLGRLIGFQQRRNEGHGLLQRQRPLDRLFQPGRQRVLLPVQDAANVLLYAGPGSGTGLLQPDGLAFQLVLKHHKIPGLKNLPENILAALGIGQQQFEEIPLGNHGDLGKLAPVQSQDGDEFSGDLPAAGDHPPVGQMEFRVSSL